MSDRYTKHEPPTQLAPLVACLKRIPCVKGMNGESDFLGGYNEDGRWWVIFWIDIEHALAWAVVRQLALILNDVSTANSATAFMPVALEPTWTIGWKPLSWALEATHKDVEPDAVANKLLTHLPKQLEDISLWPIASKPDY